MAQLKVGLIGCGQIAHGAHLPAIARLGSVARLVTVCDIRAQVAEQTAQPLGVAWTTDYHKLLEDPAIDALIITTPEFLHAEQVVDAARAGKHVLCEKPMAHTVDGADAMLAAAEKAGIKFMVAHSRRFTPRYQRIREILDSGVIGEPVMIRENERRAHAHTSAQKLSVDHWQPESQDKRRWQEMARYSAGVARGGAIHEHDLFRWFAGAEARSVQAEARIVTEGSEVPDVFAFMVTYENGVLASSHMHHEAPPRYPYHHQTEIFGTRGILRARDADQIAVTQFDSRGMHYPTAYQSLLHVYDAYFLEQKLFFESILNDTPVPLDPRNGRAAVEVALAAIHSAAIGRPVDLPFNPSTTGR